jgi:hypothetical protein
VAGDGADAGTGGSGRNRDGVTSKTGKWAGRGQVRDEDRGQDRVSGRTEFSAGTGGGGRNRDGVTSKTGKWAGRGQVRDEDRGQERVSGRMGFSTGTVPREGNGLLAWAGQ